MANAPEPTPPVRKPGADLIPFVALGLTVLLATFGQAAWLDGKIERLDAKLTSEIRRMGAKLTSEIQRVDAKLSGEIQRVEDRLNIGLQNHQDGLDRGARAPCCSGKRPRGRGAGKSGYRSGSPSTELAPYSGRQPTSALMSSPPFSESAPRE